MTCSSVLRTLQIIYLFRGALIQPANT